MNFEGKNQIFVDKENCIMISLGSGQRGSHLKFRLPINRSPSVLEQIDCCLTSGVTVPPVSIAMSVQANDCSQLL